MTESTTMTLEQVNRRLDELKNEKNQLEGTETEVYARIVGYYRAVKNWNRGKKEEYRARENFSGKSLVASTASPASPVSPASSSRARVSSESAPVPRPTTTEESTIAGPAALGTALVKGQTGQTEFLFAPQTQNDSYIYFYRKSCPNCPPVAKWLKSSGLEGRYVDVDVDSGMLDAALHEVVSAPTVVFFDDGGTETGRACNPAALDALVGLSTVAGA